MIVLREITLYWRYGPNQARFRAYKIKKQTNKQNKTNKEKKKKLTNRFSNNIGHLINDKVRLN